MKVVILSFYSGLINRGAETWAISLKEKIGQEFDIEIFGGERFGTKINWNRKNYNYWRFFLLRHAISTFPKWIKSDVVIPINGTVQTFFCRIVTWLVGKPMIVFGHSGLGADDRVNLLCSPNVFVAFSTFQKEWAEKYKLPWTKVVMIPHAVDTEMFKPSKKKIRENLVLCVAANTPDKRVDLVRGAVEKIPAATFMAVGKGNEYEYSYNEMPKVYRQAKVFCFVPKSHEAFGLVFLEAMASGLPVVTIDDAVRREIVGKAGLFVKNPEDATLLAQAIKEALLRNWGDLPRKQAEKFSWQKIVKMYEDLFESV